MRIGIDCRTILNPGYSEKAGVGHYVYFLVKNLLDLDHKNQYVLFFDKRVVETTPLERRNVKIKFFPFAEFRTYLPFTYSQMLTAGFLAREKLDLYHSPAYTVPLMYKGKSIVTVHDLAIYLYPQWYPSKWFSRQTLSLKLLIPKSLKKTERIIAVSEHTKKDLKKLFKIKDEKIKVIYEGIAIEKPKTKNQKPKTQNKIDIFKKFNLEPKFILFIGTIEPRKNLGALIETFNNLIKSSSSSQNPNFKGLQLVLAGAKGWKSKDVFKKINQVNSNLGLEAIKYLGYVSHQDKIKLLREALVFVFPSLYEGFGLPVLEAMSLGTPVITSKVASLPEVAGKAAILVSPKKPKQLQQALLKILSSRKLQKEMEMRGLEQAKKFSWAKCAKETLNLYQEVVGEGVRNQK